MLPTLIPSESCSRKEPNSSYSSRCGPWRLAAQLVATSADAERVVVLRRPLQRRRAQRRSPAVGASRRQQARGQRRRRQRRRCSLSGGSWGHNLEFSFSKSVLVLYFLKVRKS